MNTITLFLMTSKGLAFLTHLIDTFGATVIDQVITSPDRALQEDCYQEIRSLCNANGIAVFDRTDNFDVETTYSFAISWRWLIRLRPELKLIVFHDALLPRYRGFAPLVNALINKELEIGVTALFADDEYDHGEIIAQASTVISYPLRIEEAIELNNRNYLKLGEEIVERILSNTPITTHKQDESLATYSLWRDEEDYRIDWNLSSDNIVRFIHSVGYPYKGASTLMNGHLVRVLDATVVEDVVIENRNPGKLIFLRQGEPVVVCGQGLLRISSLIDESGASLLPIRKFRLRFT